MMYPEDNFEYAEDMEFTNEINELIKSEVDRRAKDVSFELDEAKKKIEMLRNEYVRVKQNYEDLQEDVQSVENFKGFRDLITKENIEDFVKLLGFETTKHIDFNGMDTERIPSWLKLLCLYYPEREGVLSILEIFEIEFPEWAHNFKLPSDYNELELDFIFDNINKVGMTNGKYFANNMGFFCREVLMNGGELKELLSRGSSFDMPWNLFLQNPLLNTEKYINKIDKLTRGNRFDYNAARFYCIGKYQETSKALSDKLVSNLPDGRLNDNHQYFIENNKDIFKNNSKIAQRYKERMSSNQFSTLFFAKFPVDMQKEFIKKYDARLDNKIELVLEKMDADKKTKIDTINSILEDSLKEDSEDLLE